MDFDVKKNYYDILWVKEDASQEEIKKAFKKAAVKHHPDKWGDKGKFQDMNEAYQVIGDEKKKSQYDAYRKGGFHDLEEDSDEEILEAALGVVSLIFEILILVILWVVFLVEDLAHDLEEKPRPEEKISRWL